MLEINNKSKELVKIDETDLKEQNLLERYHLQEAFINSWETFTKELGLPEIKLIGTEIKPHKSVLDRIDILAFDENDSNIIIFELKRDKNKNQLIQAISYAGMINTWSSKDIIENIKNNDELKETFQDIEIDFGIKIVLIAEYFDPEVILAADWLKSVYDVNICAYTIKLHKFNGKLLLDIEQKYPLKELSDVYEARKKRIDENGIQKRSWEDVKSKLEYNFGKTAIDNLLKYFPGDPNRKRFVSVKSIDGINNIIINFGNKYVNIYTFVKNKEDGKKKLNAVFGDSIEIIEWEKGLSFNIHKEEVYNQFINWLKLEN